MGLYTSDPRTEAHVYYGHWRAWAGDQDMEGADICGLSGKVRWWSYQGRMRSWKSCWREYGAEAWTGTREALG